MRFSFFRSMAAMILLGAAWGCAAGAADTAPPASVPDFAFKDLNGDMVKLSSLGGKAFIVDIWATWCPPCKQELPHLMGLQTKYQAQGLRVVGIAIDEQGAAIVKPFVDRNHLNYTVLIGTPDDLTPVVGSVESLPTTLFVGGDYKVHDRLTGYHDKAEMEKEVQDLLGIK